MTKEQKKAKRQMRKEKRIKKRKEEYAKIVEAMKGEYMRYYTFSEARCLVRHGKRPFRCEMGYEDCERRQYCNGDC